MKNHSNTTSKQSQQAAKGINNNGKSMPAKLWPLLMTKIQEVEQQVEMIGIDIGDRSSELCVLGKVKQVLVRGAVPTDRATIQELFGSIAATTVVLETGTHSPWMSRDISERGHRALVASAREVSRVLKNKKKNDRRDAEQLARLAAADEKLLGLVEHRSEQAQLMLGKMKVRQQLIQSRTRLCNEARGLVKSHGYRLVKIEPERMTQLAVAGTIPKELEELIRPLLKHVEQLNESIRKLDEELLKLAKEKYPQTKYVDQIYGVGPVVSLAFVLTIDDASRFGRSRDVGSYLGLTPGQDQSGESNPQLRITRQGDGLMRALLVNAAQCVLRKNSPECDLKRHGMKLAERGGKTARKKAVVAVARKLAVLMHKLLVSKAAYNPQHNQQHSEREQGSSKQAGKRNKAA
jgi:transposase